MSSTKTREQTHKNPDVSVIVPCYNAERYLEAALFSAKDNDIALEILVINDGSTDKSPEIANKMAAHDKRIKVITKKNGGYGSAMNKGIEEAKGSYIGILEPDDWVAPHMFDDLYLLSREYGEQGDAWPDIVKSAYWRVVNPDTRQEKRHLCAYARRVHVTSQPFTLKDQPRLVAHHPSIWSALYRREFLLQNNICFKEVPGAGWVDNPFLFETMLSAKSILYLDKPLYYYREDLPGSSSATKTAALGLERWQDMADVVEAHHVTDAGILASLYTIAARYVFDAVDKGALENPELALEIKKIAKRMDLSILLSMDNLSPGVKRFFFAQAEKPIPRISSIPYAKNLVREFFYSWRTSGLAFALSRLGLFKKRKAVEQRGKEGNPLQSTTDASKGIS